MKMTLTLLIRERASYTYRNLDQEIYYFESVDKTSGDKIILDG